MGVAIVSTCTAYLCCQPPRWGRIAVEALTQSTLAAELVYILLMPVMYYLLRRFFVAAAYNAMTSSTAALLLFGSLPVTYYIFDYATTIYSDALYSGIQALNEFLPTVLITFYVLFLPAFHLQSQRRATRRCSAPCWRRSWSSPSLRWTPFTGWRPRPPSISTICATT